MAEIPITELTNKTSEAEGTGIFDILMNSTELHLQEQYAAGRITGAEFATVYLGALQSTQQSAITFALQKQNADKQAELTTVQIEEAQEKVDLVIAQTAKAYEDIRSSQSRTVRENTLNNATIEKIGEEIDILQSQDLEVIAGTVRQDAQSAASISNINHEIAIKAQQEFTLKDKNGGVVTTYTYYVNGVSGTTTTTTDLANVVGSVISTTTADGVSASEVSLNNLILQAKEDLIQAQTTGFYSDTKQKVLKQIIDAWSVAYVDGADASLPYHFDGVKTLAAASVGTAPAIDTIIASILADAEQP